MRCHLGQENSELAFQQLKECVVGGDIELYIPALEKQQSQQPVARVFVEALKQGRADGHDALEVLDLEGKRGDDPVKPALLFCHVFSVVVLKVSTCALQILAVLVLVVVGRLLELGLLQQLRRQKGHRQIPIIIVLKSHQGHSPS
jgi:hypothetical protein